MTDKEKIAILMACIILQDVNVENMISENKLLIMENTLKDINMEVYECIELIIDELDN